MWPSRGLVNLRYRQLGTLERPHFGLKGLGEGQYLLVGLVLQVNGAAEPLLDVVSSLVVQLNPVVFRVKEIDTAGDAVGDGLVDAHAFFQEALVQLLEGLHAFYYKRDLAHSLGLGPGTTGMVGSAGLPQSQLVVLILRIGAEETPTSFGVFISDGQADYPGVKVPHLHKVIAYQTHVT